MVSRITVKAPSSTANLGPGFDVFGLAIDAFFDEITLTKIKKGIRIITDGKDGVHLYDGKNYYHAEPHKIKVVETTGAGDAFGSSFLAGYLLKELIILELSLLFYMNHWTN